MDGWKTIFNLGRSNFRGELLVFGNVNVYRYTLSSIHCAMERGGQSSTQNNRPNLVSVEILTYPGFKLHEESIEQIRGCLGKCYLKSLSVNQKYQCNVRLTDWNIHIYMYTYIYIYIHIYHIYIYYIYQHLPKGAVGICWNPKPFWNPAPRNIIQLAPFWKFLR